MSAHDRRRRRRHTAAFKAEAIAACQEPGVSLAGVALERQVNANLLRRWVKEAARKTAVATVSVPSADAGAPTFLPVVMARPKPAPTERPIRVQLRRRSLRITIEWPATAADSCALWLKELLG